MAESDTMQLTRLSQTSRGRSNHRHCGTDRGSGRPGRAAAIRGGSLRWRAKAVQHVVRSSPSAVCIQIRAETRCVLRRVASWATRNSPSRPGRDPCVRRIEGCVYRAQQSGRIAAMPLAIPPAHPQCRQYTSRGHPCASLASRRGGRARTGTRSGRPATGRRVRCANMRRGRTQFATETRTRLVCAENPEVVYRHASEWANRVALDERPAPSVAVVDAVAAAIESDPVQLPVLHGAIDTDALDVLFAVARALRP